MQVLIGRQPLFAVTPGDINALGGDSVESIAADARQKLELAIKAYREQRDPKAVAIAAGYALLASLLLYVAIRGHA